MFPYRLHFSPSLSFISWIEKCFKKNGCWMVKFNDKILDNFITNPAVLTATYSSSINFWMNHKNIKFRKWFYFLTQSLKILPYSFVPAENYHIIADFKNVFSMVVMLGWNRHNNQTSYFLVLKILSNRRFKKKCKKRNWRQ